MFLLYFMLDPSFLSSDKFYILYDPCVQLSLLF